MRCNICDKQLTDAEVVWSDDLNGYEPCNVCLEVIYDAAFSDGFVPSDESTFYDDSENEETENQTEDVLDFRRDSS